MAEQWKIDTKLIPKKSAINSRGRVRKKTEKIIKSKKLEKSNWKN
jgi:hypothetical protein